MSEDVRMHFWPSNPPRPVAPCGVRLGNGEFSSAWSKVTCQECRLEMPMDTTGRPERALAPEVERRLIAERDRDLLAEVQSVRAKAEEGVKFWTKLLEDALTLERKLSGPASGPESATEARTAGRRVCVLLGAYESAEGVLTGHYSRHMVEVRLDSGLKASYPSWRVVYLN